MDIKSKACVHVQNLTPYQSARRIGGHGHTFLNANESPKSESYLLNSLNLNRYPECQPDNVVEPYADFAGVKKDQVLVSRGSDEAIGLIIRTFVERDQAILIAPPTYGMYKVAAETNGVHMVEAKRHDDFTLSADGIIDAAAESPYLVKAVFIDSPANPLGILFSKEELIKLLEAMPDTFIVVDEAYIEFAPASSDYTALINEYDNLIITRTLSKAFALAGIRCGFTLANPETIKCMLKVIDPYPVADPVAQIAAQALTPMGINMMKARVAECQNRRSVVEAALLNMKEVEKVFPSHGNFLLVRFKDGPAIFKAEAQRGVILRSFEDKPGLKNCIRISIGSDEELDEALRVIDSFAKN